MVSQTIRSFPRRDQVMIAMAKTSSASHKMRILPLPPSSLPLARILTSSSHEREHPNLNNILHFPLSLSPHSPLLTSPSHEHEHRFLKNNLDLPLSLSLHPLSEIGEETDKSEGDRHVTIIVRPYYPRRSVRPRRSRDGKRSGSGSGGGEKRSGVGNGGDGGGGGGGSSGGGENRSGGGGNEGDEGKGKEIPWYIRWLAVIVFALAGLAALKCCNEKLVAEIERIHKIAKYFVDGAKLVQKAAGF